MALHEQLSDDPGVIWLYTGRRITGFDSSYHDISRGAPTCQRRS